MAIAEADWTRNLFTTDPAVFAPARDREYERAAASLAAIADPVRLRILHALSVGEDTPQRAAMWCGFTQVAVTHELAALAEAGVVERRPSPQGATFTLRDGHHVVLLHVALAHGRDERPQPRLLTRRRMPSARMG